MLLVGSLVAVNAALDDYSFYGGQAIRYAIAALALCAIVAVRAPAPVRLTAREVLLLIALAASGLVVFNLAIAQATRHASAALVGTVLGSGPIVMAIVGPLISRSGRPAARVVTAAAIVATGTAVATGLGGGSLLGTGLAVVALLGEVSFSLLAIPLLPKLGALRVSAFSAAFAVPLLLGTGFAMEGTALLRVPTIGQASAIGYLALVVTVIGFVLWYDAMPRLGPDRAGLFSGVMPVGALATMMLLGQGTPSPAELVGAGLVVAGIGYGLRRARPSARSVAATAGGAVAVTAGADSSQLHAFADREPAHLVTGAFGLTGQDSVDQHQAPLVDEPVVDGEGALGREFPQVFDHHGSGQPRSLSRQ